ncbi:MAG: folate family ECF transporter S component [Oscillospiraceae bacterium]|nr:folate family ECF transporter S component [Oscillospiraceae bacterium]
MKNSTTVRSDAAALKDVRCLILLALFAAMSIVLGKLLSITAGPIRISFENLPILMAGILLGAPAGVVTGILADVVGCLIVGYAINPIITVGAACIGMTAGLVYRLPLSSKEMPRIVAAVMSAHVLGSMIIKSIGLMVYYQYSIAMVLPRIPLYLAIGAAESAIIVMLLKNRAFAEQIHRLHTR